MIKEPQQGCWGVYVQPFAWKGAQLMSPVKVFSAFFFFFVVLLKIFLSVPSNLPYLFNSSSTFKYIVGLSLQSEIPLCILCTV